MNKRSKDFLSSLIQETPQQELHRLLVELQGGWEQTFNAVDLQLSTDYNAVNEWLRVASDLRQSVERSQAA